MRQPLTDSLLWARSVVDLDSQSLFDRIELPMSEEDLF